MSTPAKLRTRILRVLEAYSPNSAPLTAIADAVNTELPRKLAPVDLVAELSWLTDHEMVARVGDALDEDARRWVITRLGLGALAQ